MALTDWITPPPVRWVAFVDRGHPHCRCVEPAANFVEPPPAGHLYADADCKVCEGTGYPTLAGLEADYRAALAYDAELRDEVATLHDEIAEALETGAPESTRDVLTARMHRLHARLHRSGLRVAAARDAYGEACDSARSEAHATVGHAIAELANPDPAARAAAAVRAGETIAKGGV